MGREPKTYKTKVKQELIKFIETPDRTIDDFCIAVNKWLIDNGYEPVRGTPFKRGNEIYRLEKKSTIVERKVVCLGEK